MSVEQTSHAPVRLLIAESSENSAQEFDSLLRDAGIATRVQLTDLAMARDAIPNADLMLCNAGLPELEQLLPQLRTRAPQVPIILVSPSDHPMSTSHGMRLGAADVVQRSDPDELVLVFKRELDRVCQSQRLVELHRALREAEQRCQLLLDSTQAAIAYVHEGMHVHANDGYLKLFGFADADELVGLPLLDLLDDDSAGPVKQELKTFRQTGEERTFDFVGATTDGGTVHGTMTLAAAEYEGEACMQVTVRGREARIEPAATEHNGSAAHDEQPSGVAEFIESARSMFDSMHPHRMILVAQIDAFAELQEQYGLRQAEAICSAVHEALQRALDDRPCARLTAHQFAFAVTDKDSAAVRDFANELRSSVEGLLLEVDERTVRATISIGGTELDPDEDRAPDEVLELALNRAFATALRTGSDGGNQVALMSKEVARESPDSEAGQVLALINDAIDNQRFVLLFQPIISLRGDTEEHYEVFLRMVDRDGRRMAPMEFLRTAIEHGVAAKIDRWVILQSIKMLSTHRSKGHNTRLTVNVTANSLADPEFLQWLGVAIKAARLPSDAVIFQFTEEDASSVVRQAKTFVDGLKSMHCRASLSRFGLSENPFELLHHLPVDFVKLDGERIEQMIEDPAQRDRLTETIRGLQAAGKLTIIPMVESASMLSALWQAGANYIQGHYLQEPSTEMDYDFTTDD
ncbi:MAG: EAL domain-containing protein [Pseudomonadales bacterium]